MKHYRWQAPGVVCLPIRQTARGPNNGMDQMASAQGETMVPPARPASVVRPPLPACAVVAPALAPRQWQAPDMIVRTP